MDAIAQARRVDGVRGDRLRGRCPKISFWALRSPAARFFAPGRLAQRVVIRNASRRDDVGGAYRAESVVEQFADVGRKPVLWRSDLAYGLLQALFGRPKRKRETRRRIGFSRKPVHQPNAAKKARARRAPTTLLSSRSCQTLVHRCTNRTTHQFQSLLLWPPRASTPSKCPQRILY